MNLLLQQFAPGSSSKVLITSADSRIRVIDGVDLVHKLKGTSFAVCYHGSRMQQGLEAAECTKHI